MKRKTLFCIFPGLLAMLAVLHAPAGSGRDERAGPGARLRRPVALVLADEGRWLFTANRGSGSISVVDTRAGRVAGEVTVGKRLDDLVATPDGRRLLAVDEAAHELLLLSRRGPDLEVLRRLAVSPYPVSVRVAADGSRCFVASLWSRRLTVVDLVRQDGLRAAKVLPLPFAPRQQLPVRDGTKLVVADSFGGRLAVVDVRRGEVESVRPLPGHNIRGLALSADGKELLVAHQVLDQTVETTLDNVHWGNVISNNVRSLPLGDVLDPRGDPLRAARLHQLDEITRGAGDPSGLVVTSKGDMAVALGGTDEVVLNPHRDRGRRRLGVGRRPTALAASPDGRRLYAANTLGDAISVIDVAGGKVAAEIRLGERPKPGTAEQGESLFYDARLAHDGWFSCHSCHTDGHSNGLLNDNQGDGSFGAPKRVLSLLGARDTGPWAWNGGMAELEAQVRKSVLTTMHGRKPSDDRVRALAAYVRTLPPAPPLGRFAEKQDRESVRRGKALFEGHDCSGCHTPPAFTSGRTYNVGLTDEVGNKHFNPPSLRGVSQGGPYFHDNRAATLEDVFTRHRHQLKRELTAQELRDLIAYLQTL